MPARVVDASVLGAFLFREPRRNEAHSMMEDHDLYAPTLLPYELTSIARKKIQKYPDQKESLRKALQLGLHLSELSLVEVDFEAVLMLSLDSGLTVYDTSYLLLSRRLTVPLLTFDHRLESKG